MGTGHPSPLLTRSFEINTCSLSYDAETEIGSTHVFRARDWVAKIEEFLIRLFDTLGEWHDRGVSRRSLAKLDGRMLADIGVDPAWAETEATKPFWRG